jgi:uncharacterized protein (DUF488 family)
MGLFSEISERRAANAKKLAAFGVATTATDSGLIRVIRDGTDISIYTIGYQGRDGDNLISALRDQGIRALADVRERPISRRPEFRAQALRALCEEAAIKYQSWSALGSSVELREELQESGDFQTFAQQFRSHAIQTMAADLDRLAASLKLMPTALLCYERLHAECHRSVIADLLAEKLNATIIAIQ